jgi:NADPH2:quinone reductase
MTAAIRFSRTGGPEVLRFERIATPEPRAGEVRVRHHAIGVNFIDTYHRTGLYPLPLPSGLGLEAAGEVDAVGEGVTRFQVGDPIGYCTGPIGAYAETHVVPEGRAVRLPRGLPYAIAAACLLKGMTARYLLRNTFPVKRGDTIVVHAAAGGVGQILVQWGKALGAQVIAVVGSAEKAALASGLGADQVILSGREDLAQAVRRAAAGEGADVVYDSVGKDTFMASLDSLRPLGLLVSYGNASGPPPPVELSLLAAKGSLFVTRPTLMHYTRTTELLQQCADDLFTQLAEGTVTIAPPRLYPLAEAAEAHADLEARRTTGSLVLVP